MADLNINTHSESEQMYLVTIATLLEDGAECPVPLSRLAKELDVQSVSANQMIRKLEDERLVKYQPYHGVELTLKGQSIASRVLRHRRLWQVFLIKHLDLSFKEAEAMACKLEHLTSDEIANRLADFLDDPQVTPQGRPVPAAAATSSLINLVPLSSAAVNQQACIVKMNGPMALRAFLAEQDLGCGALVTIEGIGDNGTMLLRYNEKVMHLSMHTAESIMVNIKSPSLPRDRFAS